MNKKNLIKISAIWLISLSIFGCANVEHKPQVFQGENLITPYSGFLAGWKVFVENKAHYHSRMWQHPKLGFKNTYVVSVTPAEKISLAHFRRIIDKPGIDSCVKFTSTTINSNASTEHPTEIWQTDCLRKDENNAKILHLLIMGNESLYHVQKIWQVEYTSNEVNTWVDRFKQIYICDTRSQKSMCPVAN